MKSNPEVLYKVGGPKCIDHFLKSRTFRFTPVSALNDFNEGVSFSEKTLAKAKECTIKKNFGSRSSLGPTWTDLGFNDFSEKFSSHPDLGSILNILGALTAPELERRRCTNLGVLSMTRSPANNLLWTHYGDNGRGICVGVAASAPELQCATYTSPHRTGNHVLRGPIDVIYCKRRIGSDSVDQPWMVYTSKGVDWSYEEEVRCFKELAQDEAELITLAPETIRHIILGPRIRRSDAVECCRIQEEELGHAELFWAVPSLSGFELEFVPLPPTKRFRDTLLEKIRD